MVAIDFFHIGPQKAATTWLYQCLQEHPGVACPPKDSIHYYDMHYWKGNAWLSEHFGEPDSGKLLFDPTPSYIRSPMAAGRMYRDSPNAKLIMTIRSPVDRAFSHYWHEKKKGSINYEFEDVLTNYDLFASWIEPGFYAAHIERFLSYFRRENLLVLDFSDIEARPEFVWNQVCSFLELQENALPRKIETRVNAAGRGRSSLARVTNKFYRLAEANLPKLLLQSSLMKKMSGKSEYLNGIPPGIGEQLGLLFEPEIRSLEDLLDIDLESWRLSRPSAKG